MQKRGDKRENAQIGDTKKSEKENRGDINGTRGVGGSLLINLANKRHRKEIQTPRTAREGARVQTIHE